MEMKAIATKHKTLWKMNSVGEPLLVTGIEVNPLKKFTIPKIRRTTEKVYLSPCCTNSREYIFIQDTLNQCRLDTSCDIKSTWQFGDTKLVHNEDLEKKFTSKRSEMREIGRHGRELEEQFCFLALSQSDVNEIYQNGISTKESPLKILGNPLLGIYAFRHVDIALNYAHSRSINVESIMIFKVLFGKVKKIQPSMDKNKVSLDPSPNFDCHMSRSVPSLKDTIELQAYSSAVYFYEYNVLSKPVDKPRHCLPYAVITVKFIGQKADNGPLMTSLRFLSTGFPKRVERTCSLNNCTVAKRIGKGKDATVVFEHFRKHTDPLAQENCSCSTSNSESIPSNSNISNSDVNVQNENMSMIETPSGHTEHHLTECEDISQVHTYDSGISLIPGDTQESVNGGLLNLTHLKSVLSGLSSAFPFHNNNDLSTVTTSKLIKDPRLMRREENMGKHNNVTDLNDIFPLKKNLHFVNSEINVSSMPANSVSSSGTVANDHAVHINHLETPFFNISSDESQSHVHTMDSKDHDFLIPNIITMTGQCKNQDNFPFPMCLSNVISEVENQRQNEEKTQELPQISNIPFLIEQNNEPHNSHESLYTCTRKNNGHISLESRLPPLKPACETGHLMSPLKPLQKKAAIYEHIPNSSPECNSRQEEKSFLQRTDGYFTSETKISQTSSCITSQQKYKENDSLDSFGKNCDQMLITQEKMPRSYIFTTRNENEIDRLALECQKNLCPGGESLLQKHLPHSLDCDNIHTNSAISKNLMGLTLEGTNQSCIGVTTDVFQQAKDIPQAKELSDSSHDIKRAHDNSYCNITREDTCFHKKNEDESVSVETIQRDCKESLHMAGNDQNYILCNAQLNHENLTTDCKEHRSNAKENQKWTKEEDIASSIGNNAENIYEDKQSFHTNTDLINIDEKNKNHHSIEVLNSEEFSAIFNLTWKNCVSTDNALLGNKDTATTIKQNDTQNSEKSVADLSSATFPEIKGPSVNVASNTTVQIPGTTVPILSTNLEAHQTCQFNETCSSDSLDTDLLIKLRASDYEMDMNKNELCNSFILQNLELESEIEIELEHCDDKLLFQEDPLSHESVFCEESEASYEALKSRIDWEGLLGISYGETEILESTRREPSYQHDSEKSNGLFSSVLKNKAELNTILLPDLHIRIPNRPLPESSPIVEPFDLENCIFSDIEEEPEEEEPEEEEKASGLEMYPQCSGANSDYPCEEEFSYKRQESGLMSESEISLSFDGHNTQINQMSQQQNNELLLTDPSNVTTMNSKSRCTIAGSKAACNNTGNKKDTNSRSRKRKIHTAFQDQKISHQDLRNHEFWEKKRRLTSQDSYECFTSLSQGRIETFSLSEKHIRSVLDILNSEASLCKSKRLSRRLDRAVIHLKKAHRRVHTSLQLIAKVGGIRKGPLPKSYAIICNNFWESCDLQGYSSVSDRRYYSTRHFMSKKKYDKPEEKRDLGFEIDKSAIHISKHESYKARERITKCLSKENVTSSVSRSLTTIHVRKFCDQQYPESQLTLCPTFQSRSQSAYNYGSMENSRSSELQPFSGTTSGYLFSPDCPDQKLTKEENQIGMFLSNTDKHEILENDRTHESNTMDINDSVKGNAETCEVVSESDTVSVSRIKENTDKNYDETCITHSKVETDTLVSVLESNVKHFLNVNICKPDSLILTGYKREVEVNFPIEIQTAPVESSKQDIITRGFVMDPLHLNLMTSQKNISIPQLLPTILMTDGEEKSSVSSLDNEGTSASDSIATVTTAPYSQRKFGGNEFLKTDQHSLNNFFCTDRNEANVTENSELDSTSVTEKSRGCGEKIIKKLFFNDSSLLLKDNIKGLSSKKCITKKDTQGREAWKVKQTEKGKDPVHQKSMMGIATVQTYYKNQKSKILREFPVSEKVTKNNLIDSHLSIKNATNAVMLNNAGFNHFDTRGKEEIVKVSNDSQPDSVLCSGIVSNSKSGIMGMNHQSASWGHSETSKVTIPQKKPIPHMNDLKAKYCSPNHSAPIYYIAQILKRADKASSLQVLQEETELCQNILPLFVEAFERKQECSLEQILISRELLVECNLWNNSRHKLKPCAIDSLVELQMMMETIQFIENKKRLLGGEPTFRSLLWYDETLYGELLGRPRGFQQQSNFYPAFQGRLKYNAFCELQTYHDQLLELFEETKRESVSYYAFLKYKRQVNECQAIMKHCSDCFDFCLSVPFTCGVNFGDNLGELETLRKSTLKLIGMYGHSPKSDSYPGKQDHLWIIIEMISSKVNFIKSNETVSIKISLYGLEHIFFDAAKDIVWKERRQSFSKKYTGKKKKEMLLKINQCAFSKLQKIYDTLSKDSSSEQISNNGHKNAMITSSELDTLTNKAAISIENILFSHPDIDICCISEILDQAKISDLKQLQELTLRCTDHLEIFKKYFQMLQEDSIDNIFITEENVLDMLESQNHRAVILKPAATEIYIEVVMLSETLYFLKNSMAKKVDKQRFRSMLWFDLSLLPELVQSQEKMTPFSFLKHNSTKCLWKVIESAISELEKDLDIINKYNEAVNCSYAFHLFSRELEELSEIKKLIEKSKYSFPTYIDFVPFIASINYGSNVTELDYNYNQFSTLLKNIMAAPRKDLGKMAHIMKIMKTIEHMKMVCAKNAELPISFILCQIICNRRKSSQPKRKEIMTVQVKSRESVSKPITCEEVPSVSQCVGESILSSKKRPITVEKYESSQEEEKNIAVSSCKRQKVNVKDATEVSKEKATLKHSRTVKSHSKNETVPPSSDDLKRNHVSVEEVEMLTSLPSSLLPLKDICTSKSEGKIDLTSIPADTSEDFTGGQESLNNMQKTYVNFSAAETENCKEDDQKCVDGTSTEHHMTSSQKFKNSPYPAEKSHPSDLKPGAHVSPLHDGSELAKPVFRFVRDVHANLEVNDSAFELEDNEILNSSIKKSTSTSFSEPIFTQSKIPLLPVNEVQSAETESKENYVTDTLNPSTVPVGASSENITLSVNQTAENSLSEQQNNQNSKVLTEGSATYWNELPPPAHLPVYNSSEHAFGTSYPYYAWCVYHYSSSSSNSNSITQTYQGITSYEVQAPPPGMLTTVASVQNTRSDLLYSQYFNYFSGEPQANDFVPGNEYFQSHMPVSYNFQQPFYSQYASYQPLPQATYPCPSNSGMSPEVSWTYAPWQQAPFHQEH
ncbi:testis-expressed protein 15 [Erinaceus europaeus]|uniref:Testis-expressed protein 15 n=1 Tax=Erinaceus europaeus TaxID=9365 RepID=A0ABM3WR91_ERIEU|nr:testis-expressed protein 15 [Erinaceus europaeus]